MLYKKNKGELLDMSLFAHPTSEYRGTPFWAWNCKLDREQILRQVDYFAEMGFGGFHMHSRTGMASEYLGEEFMGHIRAAVDRAKEKGMLAWLYDEDRWASGAAGGYVTVHKKFRAKKLLLTREHQAACYDKTKAFDKGELYYLTAYDVRLDPKTGYLLDFARIDEDAAAEGDKWYAYVYTFADDPWFNNQSYPDTMDEETMATFIDITYNAYARTVGDEFDKTVPAIFTDEPNVGHFRNKVKTVADTALGTDDLYYAWSRFFEEKWQERYGDDVLDSLPLLVWITEDRRDTRVKYRYFDLVGELFAKAFHDQCGAWCEAHGIALTGHVLREPLLINHGVALGDLMRQYRSYTIPGIDMLCDYVELTTAKQCQSVVHQMGKEAMLSELYGVTNWDFDFRGHKFQGDWQAALGVTVRVPHLSWMSMGGEAKRDYPASIFYQSAWYKQYPYIEDHYARLNTVLTRGEPVVRVGVIHPEESYWIEYGPNDQTGDRRAVIDQSFATVTQWLLAEHQDFNFISESLLPSMLDESRPLCVGRMAYDAVVVPECLSLRRTTLDFLTRFAEQGGRVIFMGECPTYLDGERSDAAAPLYGASTCISFNRSALSAALESVRTVDIRMENGLCADRYLYQMRRDGERRWLFVACFDKDRGEVKRQQVERDARPVPDGMTLTVDGVCAADVYDTLSGKVSPAVYEHRNGKTVVHAELYPSDSLLLCFRPAEAGDVPAKHNEIEVLGDTCLRGLVRCVREESNVMILDQARYALDDEPLRDTEEILRLDNAVRQRLGMPLRTEAQAQPWVVPDTPAEHTVTLVYTIHATTELSGVSLCAEGLSHTQVSLNGQALPISIDGYYVDEAIDTMPLPTLPCGDSELVLKVPFSLRAALEACFLIGDFDVTVKGTETYLCPPTDTLGFGSVTHQGLPFYGGNLVYEMPVSVPEDGGVRVHLGKYIGALCEVSLDGGKPVTVAFSPYDACFENVRAGRHTLRIRLYGTRVNTFGALHNIAENFRWFGPQAWRTVGDYWSYEYHTKDMGLMTAPVVTWYR